jgi:hypothetical protein
MGILKFGDALCVLGDKDPRGYEFFSETSFEDMPGGLRPAPFVRLSAACNTVSAA